MENTNRPARRSILRKAAWPLATVAAFTVGAALAGSAQPEPEHIEVAVPAVAPEPEKVEVEVEVPVTPTACLEALDAAEDSFKISEEAWGITADMFAAAGNFDVSGMKAGSASLDALQPDLGAAVDRFGVEAVACRAY